MLRFDSILVAVDMSVHSLAAVRHACALAGDAPVRLLHVVDTDELPRYPFIGRAEVEDLFRSLETTAAETLRQLARDLESNGSKVTTEIRRGRPADEIVAASHAATLVVVGAHAKALLEAQLLGSVAEEVGRRSAAPVLFVREGAEGATKVGRILLAVDVTDPSLESIEAARDLAARTGATLEALHAIPWPLRAAVSGRFDPEGDLAARLREGAARELRGIVAKAIATSFGVQVLNGSPTGEVVRFARPDDIIVCGTHARGALGRLAFGSVATSIARSAPCPVLVVRKLVP